MPEATAAKIDPTLEAKTVKIAPTPKTTAAAPLTTPSPEDSVLPDVEYFGRCSTVREAVWSYNHEGSLQDEEKSVDKLAKAWQRLSLKFDKPNLTVTLWTIDAVNALAGEASVNFREFFGKFENQRRAIVSDNFDQFKSAYMETSTHDLKSRIYSAFVDQVIQAPFDSDRELEFCLKHFTDVTPMDDTQDNAQIVDSGMVLKILTGGLAGQRFYSLNFERSQLWELAFEKTKHLIEAGPSEIDLIGKVDLIHALVRTYSTYGTHRGTQGLHLKAREYLDGRIGEWGLNAESLFKAWSESYTSHEYGEYFHVSNIIAMMELEKLRPGICKTLYDEFRIADFERYPQEALVAQYDNRDKDMPYGVLVAAREDHNGSLSSGNDRIRRKLYTDLTALGYGLRIYEDDGRYVLKSLQAAASRYGDKNKISFVLIHQHGSEDAIGEDSRAVTKVHVRRALEHADNRRIREVRDYFVENPTLILASCSTAPIGEIFKEFGFNVIAPQIPTSLRKLDVAKSDTTGELKFVGEYSDKDAAVHFANPHAK